MFRGVNFENSCLDLFVPISSFMETWNLVIEYETVQCLITKAHSFFFLWMFYLFVIFV